MDTTHITHEYTPEIVCPWCGMEHGDSWEAPESDKWECDECGQWFTFYRHVDVSYCSAKAVAS